MTKNDGGTLYTNGMSLRDWFAGQALSGLLAQNGSLAIPQYVEDAYQIADAMLKARDNSDG